ncbi:unnamed protein product [Amoebophrya sp. A25]|nr:unnamed protein product [Amoebophrya sp. A25]|eukprot:GSA25T00007286001.1
MATQNELDNFFENNAAMPGMKPPPPIGVDTRDFHHNTAGGFGNTPMPGSVKLDGDAGGGFDFKSIDLKTMNMETAQKLFGALAVQAQLAVAQIAVSAQGGSSAAFSALPGGADGGPAGGAGVLASVPSLMPQSTKPWKAFFVPLRKPADSAQALGNLTSNVIAYRTNYLVAFAIWQVVWLLLLPGTILLFVVLAAAWTLFLKKNQDPEWAVQAGGVTFGPSQRYLVMGFVTGLLLLFWCGSAMLSNAFYFTILAIVHGVLHDVEEGAAGGAAGGELGPPAAVAVDTV